MLPKDIDDLATSLVGADPKKPNDPAIRKKVDNTKKALQKMGGNKALELKAALMSEGDLAVYIEHYLDNGHDLLETVNYVSEILGYDRNTILGALNFIREDWEINEQLMEEILTGLK